MAKQKPTANGGLALNKKRVYRAVNWDKDSTALMFLEQNIKQFWVDTEFTPSKDRKVWDRTEQLVKETYKKVLGGLTLLDTQQGNVGMPKIAEHVQDLQAKSVLSYMGMMENIHAKSYSTIFSTLVDERKEIDEVFDWVEENVYLQRKADMIVTYYENIKEDDKFSLYMAMVASVYLESFLFYSGFFYPLFLAGQGKLIASGEIINKIIADEAIHGLYIGMLAQDIYEELTDKEKEMADYETIALLEELMENEKAYTEEVYAELGLDHEVKDFIMYNANKALMNLGREPHYPEKKINSIVENGLKTHGTHDFFSTKGGEYVVAKHRPLTDADFVFDWLKDRKGIVI